jgi:hypothetical protein
MLPQLIKASVVVIPDVAVRLAELCRDFGECKPVKKVQSQRCPLILR